MFDLTDRVVLVTGGGRGIGRAISLELARAGASVVVGYLDDSESALATVNDILNLRSEGVAIAADLRRAADVERLLAEAHEWRGHLHGLVANAGVFDGRPTDSVDDSDRAEILETDLVGTIRVVREAVPYLLQHPGASVVLVSSILASHPVAGGAAYQAAKAGVEQLARAFALEFAPRIRFNAVAPGFIRTEMNRSGWEDPTFHRVVEERTPLHRWGEPEDIAPAVRYLLARESAWVTGTLIPVDGGASIP